MICHPATKRDGVSLMEIMLALSVFLIAFIGIAQLVDMGSDRANETIMENTAVRLAQSKMAEVEAGIIDPWSGGNGFYEEEPLWQWSVEPGPAELATVVPVTVRVWREARGQIVEMRLTQMVLDPTLVGSGSEVQAPSW